MKLCARCYTEMEFDEASRLYLCPNCEYDCFVQYPILFERDTDNEWVNGVAE